MRVFLIAIAIALSAMTHAATAATAADSYRYTFHFDGYPEPSTQTGHVTVDGDRYRVERDPEDDPRTYDVILTAGGDDQAKALNLENRTFFDATGEPEVTSGLYLLLPIGDKKRTKDFALEVSDEDGEALAGYPTRKRTLHFSYTVSIDFHGEKITGTVRSTASYWVTDQLSLQLPPLLRPHVQTGFSEIDESLAAELSKMKGFPLKQHVSITRAVSGEAPDTATLTKTIEKIENIEVEPSTFWLQIAGVLIRQVS